MLFFLHGSDTYRLTQKLKEIENQYRRVHGSALNLEKLDAGQISFRDFWDALNQQSMFIKTRLFFLENVFSNESFKKGFLKKIEAISDSQNIIVVVEKEELKKTDKLFRVLEEKAKCQHFEILKGQKLKNWTKKELAKYQTSIEPSALEKLLNAVGYDLWQLSNEIKKLATYKRDPFSLGKAGLSPLSITEEDIDLFIKPKVLAEIFKTIDELAQGNKKAALQMLQNHLDKGDSPFYLLSMINYQFRNLLLVKSCTDNCARTKKLGLHPFVLQKTNQLARSFSLEQLKKIYHQIFEADLDIKTGKTPPEEGLRMLIAEI